MMKLIETPTIHNEIVKLFLEKLEIMTEEERHEILLAIRWINHPQYTTK
jgi:glycerol-3-phosphate cytidylyltransferase-like family protein